MATDTHHDTGNRVSVIIPSADSHRTIKQTLTSVMRQTYADIETIVVLNGDDTEATARIVAEFPQVKVYTLAQANVFAARRLGFEKSHGDYILFADADDILDRNMVASAVACIKAHKADIVQCRLIQFATKYGLTVRWKFPCCRDTSRALEGIVSDASLFNPAMIAKLYRRSVLGQFPEIDYDGFWGEDRLFNMQIFSRDVSVAYCAEARYLYRFGGGCRDMSAESRSREVDEVHRLKVKYLTANGLERYIDAANAEYRQLCDIIERHRNPDLRLKIKRLITRLLSY